MSKENYSRVVEIFEYVVNESKAEYVRKLMKDLKSPLAEEGILASYRMDTKTNEYVIMLLDIKTRLNTILIGQ